MRKIWFFVFWAVSLPALADVLTLPTDTEAGAAPAVPARGITMDQVLAEFGEPQLRKAAVGDPPITRWDYGRFVVYFEYERVINSVIPGQPAPIYHQDELRAGN